MKKILLAIVVIIILAFVLLSGGEPADAPTVEVPVVDQSVDTTESIVEDLEVLDLGDLDMELDALDEDINTL